MTPSPRVLFDTLPPRDRRASPSITADAIVECTESLYHKIIFAKLQQTDAWSKYWCWHMSAGIEVVRSVGCLTSIQVLSAILQPYRSFIPFHYLGDALRDGKRYGSPQDSCYVWSWENDNTLEYIRFYKNAFNHWISASVTSRRAPRYFDNGPYSREESFACLSNNLEITCLSTATGLCILACCETHASVTCYVDRHKAHVKCLACISLTSNSFPYHMQILACVLILLLPCTGVHHYDDYL